MWSFGGLFVKVLTRRYGVEPAAVACLRSAAGGLVLAWALPRVAGAPGWRVAGAGAAYALVVGTFVAAVAGTTAANAIFLQYAYPLVVAVGAWVFFKEALNARTLLALALCGIGVITIVTGSWKPEHLVGLGYGVVSAIAFAAFVLVQRSIRAGDPVALSSLYNLLTAAVLLPLAYDKLGLSAAAFALVAAMGIFQLALPYVMFMKGLRTVPATEAALITLLEPVLHPVWVWIGVREAPNAWTVIGAVLITAALLVRFSAPARAPTPRTRKP